MIRSLFPSVFPWAICLAGSLCACHEGLHAGNKLDAAFSTLGDGASEDAMVAGGASDARNSDVPVPSDSAPAVDEVARIDRIGTNYGHLVVVVYSDGSATRTRGRDPSSDAVSDGALLFVLPAGSPPVAKFLQDLALVGDVSAIEGPPTCPGDSVSFGTRTYVTVGRQVGGNLQCPDDPTPAQAALASDCVTLTQD